jgi:hypothetical protein
VLPVRQTIHQATKVYDTGAKPLLVTCDDLHDWVLKHNETSKLINEILGSKFAEIWGLDTPGICLINTQDEHIPQNKSLQIRNFRKLCFGSFYLESSIHVDKSSTSIFEEHSFRKKIRQKEDLLLIGLFDIWLSNEDRTHNNSNLLLNITDISNYRFCVFDHGEIFNSGNLKYGLAQITEDESIINTDLASILFKKGTKLDTAVNNIVETFYLCVSECEKVLTSIISLIPSEWEIDTELLEENLRKQLFNEKWLKDCIISFRSFIQIKFYNK